jgi:hypothetical protein
MDPEELVPVYVPADALEAEAIRQALTDAGVACHVDGANVASWAVGGLENTGRWRMRLLVRAADAERARRIIDEGHWPRYT